MVNLTHYLYILYVLNMYCPIRLLYVYFYFQVIHRMTIVEASPQLIDDYMKEIARSYNVPYPSSNTVSHAYVLTFNSTSETNFHYVKGRFSDVKG